MGISKQYFQFTLKNNKSKGAVNFFFTKKHFKKVGHEVIFTHTITGHVFRAKAHTHTDTHHVGMY